MGYLGSLWGFVCFGIGSKPCPREIRLVLPYKGRLGRFGGFCTGVGFGYGFGVWGFD